MPKRQGRSPGPQLYARKVYGLYPPHMRTMT